MIVCYGRRRRRRIGDGRALYYDQFIEPQATANPEDEELRVIRIKAMSNLIGYYGLNGDLAAATALYDDLTQIAAQFPDDQMIQIWVKHARYNLEIARRN